MWQSCTTKGDYRPKGRTWFSEERSAVESRGEREGEWGGGISSSSNSGVWESVVSSIQRGPGQSPGRKRFYCNLISADCLCWQKILHLFGLKSGIRYSSVQKVGVPLLLVPRKLVITPMCRTANSLNSDYASLNLNVKQINLLRHTFSMHPTPRGVQDYGMRKITVKHCTSMQTCRQSEVWRNYDV